MIKNIVFDIGNVLVRFQQYGVKPDILTVAKALGCGVPVGAFAATEEVEIGRASCRERV